MTADARASIVRLADGDVRTIRIIHRADSTRLVIIDRDEPDPLIVAILGDSERRALVAALNGRIPKAA